MLIIESPVAVYDLSQIKQGYLLYAKHMSWEEGRAGIVTAATETRLTVQYHPGIGNVTNHFHIPVSEALTGEWEIRWSADMSQVHGYSIDGDTEPGKEGENESGGTDL